MVNILYDEKLKTFHLSNSKISYILQVENYNILSHVYFGKRITTYSGGLRYPNIKREFEINLGDLSPKDKAERSYSIGNLLLEYPVYGRGDFRASALVMKHSDGSRISDFRYKSYKIVNEKPKIVDMPSSFVNSENDSKTLIVTLEDNVKNIELELYYTIFKDEAIIARSNKIINKGNQVSYIEKIASASIDFSPSEREIIHLNGTWGRERMITREKLNRGTKLLDSKRGTSSHQQTPFISLVDKHTTEFLGESYSAQLIYSGSFEIIVEQDPYEQVRLMLGIQSQGLSWKLSPNDSFQTPEVILNYSSDGLNGMSQNFHSFIKKHVIRSSFNTLDRPILANNWEGTYFDFTEEKIRSLIDEAEDLGIELFVLDDGWFGERNDEDRSLGDWHVNFEKLPNGLEQLSNYVHDKGMKFGLWFEPEMISENSDLYRKYPDWAIQTPNRNLSTGRHQYVLDMSRKDVRENIFEQMINIIDNVKIDYIKWDMNRHLSEIHSLVLPPDQSGEISHRYTVGVYKLIAQIVNRYPDILFESCSGGGGRFDLGMLYYMPQTWTSDNTDPIARLKIQTGTSLAYPINTMGAHVSASPNHQTNRVVSLKTRTDVAFAGLLGYELDLDKLTKLEKEEIKQNILTYKKYRTLIQQGQFTRLINPFENDALCCWMVSSFDQTQAIVFFFDTFAAASKPLQKIKLVNLNPILNYEIRDEENRFEATGEELMNGGFYITPQLEGDFASRVYYIKSTAKER